MTDALRICLIVSGIDKARKDKLVPCAYTAFLDKPMNGVDVLWGCGFAKDTQDFYAHAIVRALLMQTDTDDPIAIDDISQRIFVTLKAGFKKKLDAEVLYPMERFGAGRSGKPYNAFEVWKAAKTLIEVSHSSIVETLAPGEADKLALAKEHAERWALLTSEKPDLWPEGITSEYCGLLQDGQIVQGTQ